MIELAQGKPPFMNEFLQEDINQRAINDPSPGLTQNFS